MSNPQIFILLNNVFPPFPSIFLSKDEGADKYEYFL